MKKPSGPSAPKLFFDTQVVPLAANIAGGFEVALDRVSARSGVRPALLLTGGAGFASLVLLRILTRGSKADPGDRT